MSLNWGILGLGKIANKFASDLALVEGCNLAAVASRSLSQAQRFQSEYDTANYYEGYESLVNDDDVDIIYIATPHNFHLEHALLAMQHGKHVLCEKPLAVNASQVAKLVEASKTNRVFLMEGMWTRFNPSIEAILRQIQAGEIGEISHIRADFSFFREEDSESRLYNPNLAGGSILDIGVYPIFLSYLLLGYPNEIKAEAIKAKTGVDLQMSALMTYDNAIANVMSGFDSTSDMIARIFGRKGNIYIDKVWHETQGYALERQGEQTKINLPTKGRGFTYEIQECMRCIEQGRIESEKWSHTDSLNLISICDEIRAQIGLKYPFE